MDVQVGSFEATVHVEDRRTSDPQFREEVVAEVLRRLDERASTEQARRSDASLWASAREDRS